MYKDGHSVVVRSFSRNLRTGVLGLLISDRNTRDRAMAYLVIFYKNSKHASTHMPQ